jgi:RNA polymerase sigma factor (sigma-70 family)
MSSESPSLTTFFTRLREGDHAAAEELWRRFCPRLLGLAKKVLKQRPLPVLDAEDAAQSAFASFWRRAERGDFSREMDRNDLWRVLATITVRKARRNMARELAEKRGGGRLKTEAEMFGADEEFRLEHILAAIPSRDFDLLCEELIGQLVSEELQSIALYKLMSYTNREIAQMLDCTERKIERKLQVIRATWQRNEPGEVSP